MGKEILKTADSGYLDRISSSASSMALAYSVIGEVGDSSEYGSLLVPSKTISVENRIRRELNSLASSIIEIPKSLLIILVVFLSNSQVRRAQHPEASITVLKRYSLK